MSAGHIVKAYESLYPAINKELSDQSSKRYNNDQLTLLQLEEWRNSELPQIVHSRYQEHKKTWINKDELVLLMDWKLAKGKFRPTLPKLIKSNSEEDVKHHTEAGFQVLLDFIDKHADFNWKDADADVIREYTNTTKKAFKAACVLKGVGPATASLILSLLTRISKALAPPFFSDESFLYYVVDAERPGSKIKYNVKEYTDEFLPVFFTILKDNDSDMSTLEKGAWALKSFEVDRIDKLINVKLEFQCTDDDLNRFKTQTDSESPDNKDKQKTDKIDKDHKKRKSPVESKNTRAPKKRVKKE